MEKRDTFSIATMALLAQTQFGRTMSPWAPLPKSGKVAAQKKAARKRQKASRRRNRG